MRGYHSLAVDRAVLRWTRAKLRWAEIALTTPGGPEWDSKPPLGPNGERLCRNCRKPLAKGQRHNCSPKCSDEWMCKTSPSHLRRRLHERDHGVCAICRRDTGALKQEYRQFCGMLKQSWREWASDYAACSRPWESRLKWLNEHGIPRGRECADWWDADHIVPVIEGGGECGLENYRTLCIPCHKQVTRGLRARMAQRRKNAKALPLIDAAAKEQHD